MPKDHLIGMLLAISKGAHVTWPKPGFIDRHNFVIGTTSRKKIGFAASRGLLFKKNYLVTWFNCNMDLPSEEVLMFLSQKLIVEGVLLCSLCSVQAGAMQIDRERGVHLSDQIKITAINDMSPTFDISEDLEKFQQALLSMKVANDYKLKMTLDGHVYFIDKTEDIVAEFSRDNLWNIPRGLMSVITKATLVDTEEMENPRRVRFFYNIKLEYWGLMPLSSKKFRRFKMTRLLD